MLPISPTNRPTEKRRQKKVLLQLWPRADAGPFKPLPNDESGFPAGPGKAQCRGVRDPQGATDSGNPNPARGRPAASRDRHPEGQEPPVGQECQAGYFGADRVHGHVDFFSGPPM
jgi:hypothetical protein